MKYTLMIACCLLSLGAFARQNGKGSTDYKKTGAPLPSILVYKSDGSTITNKDVKNKANLFVMIFNPNCSHCEDMTVELEHNIGLFKKSKLLLVAAHNQAPFITGFEHSYHTDKYAPTMMVGLDSSMHLVDKTFQYKMLPQISVYNKKRKLVKVFTGDTKIEDLKPYIE